MTPFKIKNDHKTNNKTKNKFIETQQQQKRIIISSTKTNTKEKQIR